MNDTLLWQIRHFVYQHFADTTHPPSVDITAEVTANHSMNNQYIEPITRPTHGKSKFFGFLRSLGGAIIGLIVFMLFTTRLWMSYSHILLSPGYLVVILIRLNTSFFGNLSAITSKTTFDFVVFGVSAIPPTFLGALILSKRKITRRIGIALLVLYALALIIISPVVYALMS